MTTTPQTSAKIRASLIPAAHVNDGVRDHLSVAEAAVALGVHDSTIYRAARRLGVQRISGRTVRGGILIEAHPVPIVIVYSR